MREVIFVELKKLKRLKILWLGVISVVISQMITNIQASQMSKTPPTLENLLDLNLWNNATIILPFTFALIGGYLINREYTEGTRKNLLVVPVSWAKAVKAKIIIAFLFVLCLVIINAITLLLSVKWLGGSGVHLLSAVRVFAFLFIVESCLYIGILPLILFFSKVQGGYLGGTLLAMIMGVISIFFANGKLVHYDPIMTGFSFISTDKVGKFEGKEIKSFVVIVFLILISKFIYLRYYQSNKNQDMS